MNPEVDSKHSDCSYSARRKAGIVTCQDSNVLMRTKGVEEVQEVRLTDDRCRKEKLLSGGVRDSLLEIGR